MKLKSTLLISFLILPIGMIFAENIHDHQKELKRKCLEEKEYEACDAKLTYLDPQPHPFSKLELIEVKKIIRVTHPNYIFADEVEAEEMHKQALRNEETKKFQKEMKKKKK